MIDEQTGLKGNRKNNREERASQEVRTKNSQIVEPQHIQTNNTSKQSKLTHTYIGSFLIVIKTLLGS